MATATISATRASGTALSGSPSCRSGPMSHAGSWATSTMNPEETVQAFIDCGAELALAHHYGTFQLTDEAIDAPLIALAEALTAAGLTAKQFGALRPGQVWQA